MNEFMDDIEPEKNDNQYHITSPFSPNDISLSNPPMNLGDLIDRIKHGWINFDTDYQREQNLWKPVQQSRLIESILLGLRLPAFYFEEVNKRSWNIIDGLQRCCAIRNFCIDETLELSDLEFLGSSYNGVKFSDLPYDIQCDIRMLPITVNVLANGVPNDVRYVLFKRLNTGGINLEPQEIRNAVYQGKAIDVVKKMASSNEFLQATRNRIPTIRKQDHDFVSRFVAFFIQGFDTYKVDIESYLNGAMEILQTLEDSEIHSLQGHFKDALNLSVIVFEDKAFRKIKKDGTKGPLNKAVFEIETVTFAKLDLKEQIQLIANKELLVENFKTALKINNSFYSSLSGGTGKKESVLKRFSEFRKIVDLSIQNKKYAL